MGGLTGQTDFQVIHSDAASNIVVGGITLSDDLAPIGSPLIGLIDNKGFIKWMKYFDSSLLGISSV